MKLAVAFTFALIFAVAANGQGSFSGTTPGGLKFKVDSGSSSSGQSAESARKVLEKRLKMYLKLAEDLIAREQYELAISNLKSAMRVPLNDSRRQTAFDQLRQIMSKAKGALADARDLYTAGEYVAARKKAAHVATVFRGIKTAVKARRLLRKIDSDPQALAAINEMKAKRLYELTKQTRLKLDKVPDAILELHDRLRVLQLRKYAQTESGKAAKAELIEIRKNHELMKKIEQIRLKREIASKMSLARTYLQSGMIEKALKLMDEVIAADPTSKEAKTASALKKTTGG